ncbi:hypothetical protein OG216_17660 [Streptomycetaceae bacterium NBC_01309]
MALAATALGTWQVACALGLRRPIDTATAWLLLGIAQLSGLALLVGGALRQLNAWGLFVGSVVVAITEVAVVRRWFAERARAARPSVRGGLAGMWRHPVVTLLGGIVLAQYAWRAAIGTFLGPLDWDGLWYHVTGPDLWLRTGHIGHTADVLWADVYPQGQELLTAWSGAFLGTTRYAWASGVPFLLLGLTAVAGLARSAGASRAYALLGALGFLAVPAVFLQASTSYVDVGAATTALAAFQLVVASREAASHAAAQGSVSARRELYRYFAVVGIALGLAIGVKSSNLPVAALVVTVAAVQAWRVTRALRMAVPGVLLMGVPMMLLGSYWYLRTWIRYSNPFHPFSMLGFEGRGTVRELIVETTTPKPWLDRGWVQQTEDSWRFDLDRHPYMYDQVPGGLGAQWLYAVLPAILTGTLLFLATRRYDLVYGLVVPAVVCSLASPAPWWARYQLLLPALGGVCLAALLSFVAGHGAARSRRHRSSPAGASAARLSSARLSIRRLSVGRRALAAALALAFVALTARSMWWATAPTHVWTGAGREWHRASIGELVDLMRDPDRDSKMQPTQAYAPIRRNVPPGETVAFTENTAATFAHLIIGDTGARDIDNLGSPADAAELARKLRESGARYLLLSEHGKDGELLRQVRNDPRHYRTVVGGGRIGWFWIPGGTPGPGSDLFEVGEFAVPP